MDRESDVEATWSSTSLDQVRAHFAAPGQYSGISTYVTMRDEEWIKKLEDGRGVKFTYQELPEDGAFITAQLAGNDVVYSVVLTKARNPLSREDVESRFKGELSKK